MRALPDIRRLVVKVGSSSLTGADGLIDQRQISSLVTQITAARRNRIDVVFVSSGAIAAGLPALGRKRRPTDIPTLQAAASVGQNILVHEYQRSFARRKVPVGQVLLTQDDFVRRKGYLNARAAITRLLELGVVPIVNENDTVAVDEIRFGDNDRLAALVANLVHADLLVMLSDIDGLYTEDPRSHRATLIAEVTDPDHLSLVKAGKSRSGLGSGGMASKVEAARIATASGVHVVIASARNPRVIAEILSGRPVGTHFSPHRARGSSRKLWIRFAQTTRGTIFVDAGAVNALVEGNRSLLPAGVVRATGSFALGDAVDVAGPDGAVFAKGLVNYASEEIAGVAGRSIRDGGREVIHRDSLVIL
ncbi:MAG TPA: glutamate 5-kinase [Actinomycetota bacterium]|nr:glutamate 5-kinase [Actinomycetota bacterium]